jgi:hypothetical protein
MQNSLNIGRLVLHDLCDALFGHGSHLAIVIRAVGQQYERQSFFR